MRGRIIYHSMKAFALLCILAASGHATCCSKYIPAHAREEPPSQFILLNGVAPTPAAFREIVTVFGPSAHRPIGVGVGFIISYLQYPPAEAAARLRKYLRLSEEFNLPVIVQLDGRSEEHTSELQSH